MLAELGEQRAAGRVGERRERAIERGLLKVNHLVKC